jgi:hypothetical protein
MSQDDLVVGVLKPSVEAENEDLRTKLRDLTIACCRFDFSGPLFESDSVDDLLDRAAETGAGHCVIQSHGHAMVRLRDIPQAIDTNFIKAVRAWLHGQDFFVAGQVLGDPASWYGLDELCFVVNLEDYRRFGKPRFTPTIQGPVPTVRELPGDGSNGTRPRTLEPAGGRAHAKASLPGWGLVAASLEHGKAVVPFNGLLERCRYDLRPKSAGDVRSFLAYREDGIFSYDATNGASNPDWKGFLNFVKDQARHAKKGVFLGNWESYDDIETPPKGFASPVSAVYGVAAGFKVNRILHTHGFDGKTRVFHYDYSPVALGIKKAQVEEWDGRDYPAFIASVAERFPDAFYQLWGLWGAPRPGALNLDMVKAIWDNELRLWGGEEAFVEHWSRFRTLSQSFVHCDLYARSGPLLDSIVPDPGAILWWSNAFHSLNGVWFYSRPERQRIYREWLEALGRINPDLWLYGKDVDNLEIGGTQIRDQLQRPVGE